MKYDETGAKTIVSRSGRPKILTERDKRHLKAIVIQNWCEPIAKIHENFNKSTGNEVSERTIRHALYELEYDSYTTFRKPLVSESNRKICLNWACKKYLWTINEWKKVI